MGYLRIREAATLFRVLKVAESPSALTLPAVGGDSGIVSAAAGALMAPRSFAMPAGAAFATAAAAADGASDDVAATGSPTSGGGGEAPVEDA